VGRAVHTELGCRRPEACAGPEAKAAFDGLEDITITRSALRPVVAGHGTRRQQRLDDLAVLGYDPDGGQADLEVAQRLLYQRPGGGVETDAIPVLLRRWRHLHADIAGQPLRYQLRRLIGGDGASPCGEKRRQKEDNAWKDGSHRIL